METADTPPIDYKKLESYRTITFISVAYLRVWNSINEYLKKSTHLKLDEYLVSIDEHENMFIVSFSKPFLKPVLGGGVGKCTLDKNSNEIKYKLIK